MRGGEEKQYISRQHLLLAISSSATSAKPIANAAVRAARLHILAKSGISRFRESNGHQPRLALDLPSIPRRKKSERQRRGGRWGWEGWREGEGD